MYVLQLWVGNKVELSRIPRSRRFLAVLSSSLFVCRMLSRIHPSPISIKTFYILLLLSLSRSIFIWMFIVHSEQLLSHSHWREGGREVEKQDINLTSWVYSFIVWSDFMKRKHMGVEERNCCGVNVSFEMPLLAAWQGRKKKTYGGFVKIQWWKRSQGRPSGRGLNFPFSHRGQLSQRTHLTQEWQGASLSICSAR